MLELYQFEECPYCSTVRSKLTDLGIDYIMRNVPRDRSQRQKVIKVSGQPGVPVLVDDNKVIVDSEKIIEYLEKKYSN